MTTSVSLQRLPQPEKTSQRIERRVPYQKTFAIAALFFLPGAAGVVMPRTTPLPGLQISNATCPSLRAEPINTYVTAGSGAYFFSQAIRQAETLRLEEFGDTSSDAVFTMQDRLEDRVKDLRVNEADACNLAAELADTPNQKLEWVARGLKELKISSDPEKDYSCLFEDNLPVCAAAASLWLTAARAFQELPSHETRYPYSIVPYQLSSDLRSRAPVAAALCLYNAAYCLKSLGNHKEAFDLLNESIRIMKDMDTTNCTLSDRIRLQEEIVSTCIAARNLSPNKTDTALTDRIYSEAMVAQEMYLQLQGKTTYHTIKRALRLADAAYFTPNLTQSAELYREARDTVQKVWDENPTQCRNIPEFANNERYSIFGPSFTLANSLLGRLRAATNQVEKEIERKNAGLLRSAWDTLSHWLSGPALE
jgi:hypothetical protein